MIVLSEMCADSRSYDRSHVDRDHGLLGSIGTALSRRLRDEGQNVVAVVRRQPGDNETGWISIDDVIGAIERLLANDISGAVSLTAPNPVTSAEVTSILGSDRP